MDILECNLYFCYHYLIADKLFNIVLTKWHRMKCHLDEKSWHTLLTLIWIDVHQPTHSTKYHKSCQLDVSVSLLTIFWFICENEGEKEEEEDFQVSLWGWREKKQSNLDFFCWKYIQQFSLINDGSKNWLAGFQTQLIYQNMSVPFQVLLLPRNFIHRPVHLFEKLNQNSLHFKIQTMLVIFWFSLRETAAPK